MPSPEDIVRVRHMLDHAREAIAMIEHRSRTDLESDRMLQLSLVRLVEIVGEAAARVTPALQQEHPEIPWASIRGMRDRLIHGYDFVDYDVLWQTITSDLPDLVTLLSSMLPADHTDGRR